MKNTLCLIIMDGFGIGEKKQNNAIYMAKTPIIDNLFKICPHTLIGASGMDVGLPTGQMGNSEVGHTNIGAGRIVYQNLTRITKSIDDGDFFENKALLKAILNAKENNCALHIMGLLSDGGVHSHNTHLYALLKLAKKNGLTKVYLHNFMDGRDVSPTSGVKFMKELKNKTSEIGIGTIATVSGRYYAMDRDNRWDRIKTAYDTIIYGIGNTNNDPVKLLENSYNQNVTDEFIVPTVIDDYKGMKNGDSVIFYNFRPDRARELTKAIVEDEFNGFDRINEKLDLTYVTMTEYDASFKNTIVAYNQQSLSMTLGEYISKKGLTQLRIAETEKYAHVTFFFNGGKEDVYENEERILIPSPKVATYDLKPEMSANEVTIKTCNAIESGKYDIIILNFANCDMVGHTGIIDATIKAVETVDKCIGDILQSIKKVEGKCIITADHGNADIMTEIDGSPFTKHTINPVPFIMYGDDVKLRQGGVLADIAPTMLDILKLDKPSEMTGKSLVV